MDIKYLSNNKISLKKGKETILIVSDKDIDIKPSNFSPSYGQFIETKALNIDYINNMYENNFYIFKNSLNMTYNLEQ